VQQRQGKGLGRLFAFLGLTDLGFVGKWVGMSTLVGIVGGLAAAGFKWLLGFLRENLLERATGLEGEGLGGLDERMWLVLLILPAGGLLVGWLTHRFAPEAEGHGTEQLIRTFHNLSGRVRRRVIGLKALTAAITIGTGGSAGQEGPVAQVGSGVGSAVSDALRLTERDRRTFLLAGASAGIGALFTAPMGGALFAPEVLYRKPEFEGEAIIPCIISSIVAYTTFTTISGEEKAIEISEEILAGLAFNSSPAELGIYLVLGLLCAVTSFLYVRTFDGIHSLSRKLTGKVAFLRPAIGGMLLAILALAITGIAGRHGVLFGGYKLMEDSIAGEHSIAGGMAITTMLVLVVGKILATSFSIASGGSGGVFAPSLAIGALLGAVVGKATGELFPELGIEPACFALVGMGGFFAGVAKTPIASIIIVCEMTGSYGLLAPLMLVSVIHMLFATKWTIYNTQVDGLVDSPAHAGDFVVDVLEQMKVSDLLEGARQPHLIPENMTLRRSLAIVSTARGNYFPVVDEDERLVGIFSLSDVRRIFQEMEVADLVIVRDFMVETVVTVTPSENLNDALQKLNEHGLHEIPVVHEADGRHVLGMLTRNNLGAAYHRRLHALKRAGAAS